MRLCRNNLALISGANVTLPGAAVLEYPERILQFGTGVLLRGLVDYFVDKANREGTYQGRVVIVKSTSQGDIGAFTRQDGLYTVCVRGWAGGKMVSENIVNSSVSRVIDAAGEWEKVLQCAELPQMNTIISNTTEVGIRYDAENIRHGVPASYPGKLLAFLYARYQAFGGIPGSGTIIIPTELIPDNGKVLKDVLEQLSAFNQLEDAFRIWLTGENRFCNSLVDRIVPGMPGSETLAILEEELGYTDELLIIAEHFRLWAIEGDEDIRIRLGFTEADPGLLVAPDIGIYRELKLRLLNATHTLSSGLAFLSGLDTVKDGMENTVMENYIYGLMKDEITKSIPYPVNAVEAENFGNAVLDRFRNPSLRHQWLNITMQYSAKMRMRVIPLLLEYFTRFSHVPEKMATGMAAYILFSRPVKEEDGKYYGEWKGVPYRIADDRAEIFYARWRLASPQKVVQETLRDATYWGCDLDALPGFTAVVTRKMLLYMEGDILTNLQA